MGGPKQARAGGSPGKSGRTGGSPGRAGGPAAAQRDRQAGKGAGSRPATAGGGASRGGKAAQRGGGARQPATAGPAAEIKAKPAGDGPRWLPLTTFILSLVGLGLSVYLTITHYTDTAPAGCPVNSTINCTKVTTSPESIIFGIFPVAVLGLAFYVFMVAINSPWAWRANLAAIRWARLAGVLTGIVFVLYLVYAELFQIDAICEYCTGVHIITFILFGLVMYNAATWSAPAGKAVGR
jgi:uncharacterized membrane protein